MELSTIYNITNSDMHESENQPKNKEDINMANRIELNEQDIGNVVGGAFTYKYDKQGNYKCKVDGGAVYYAREGAREAITKYDYSSDSLTSQDLVNWALQNGWFSTSPINE